MFAAVMFQRLESLALRLRPHRLVLVFVSLVAWGVMFVSLAYVHDLTFALMRVALPVMMWSWGLVCLSFWFSPIRPEALVRWYARLIPSVLRTFLRWYAVVFLVAWFGLASVVALSVLVGAIVGALS